MNDQLQCPLFSLPPELRNTIYSFVFAYHGELVAFEAAEARAPSPALLATCRRINHEAKASLQELTLTARDFWRETTFTLEMLDAKERAVPAIQLSQAIGISHIGLIKRLEIVTSVEGSEVTMHLNLTRGTVAIQCATAPLMATRLRYAIMLNMLSIVKYRLLVSDATRPTSHIHWCFHYWLVQAKRYQLYVTGPHSQSLWMLEDALYHLKRNDSQFQEKYNEFVGGWGRRELRAVLEACYEAVNKAPSMPDTIGAGPGRSDRIIPAGHPVMGAVVPEYHMPALNVRMSTALQVPRASQRGFPRSGQRLA